MKLNLPILATALSTLCSFALPAIAEIPIPSNQWYSVGQDNNGNVFQVDQGTIKTNGYVKSYWSQTFFSQGKISISRQYMTVNCATNIYSTGWLILADSQGKIAINTAVSQPSQQVVAGTIGDTVTNAVCTGFIDNPMLSNLERARQSDANAITESMKAGMIGIR